jgi:hypothetical protein
MQRMPLHSGEALLSKQTNYLGGIRSSEHHAILLRARFFGGRQYKSDRLRARLLDRAMTSVAEVHERAGLRSPRLAIGRREIDEFHRAVASPLN